jgi:hypothetical protein
MLSGIIALKMATARYAKTMENLQHSSQTIAESLCQIFPNFLYVKLDDTDRR